MRSSAAASDWDGPMEVKTVLPARPDTELASHYFQAVRSEQFDAYVWLEQTIAVTPLAGDRPHGAPDTYPIGL
jgi:erythromycin esterase-like protein